MEHLYEKLLNRLHSFKKKHLRGDMIQELKYLKMFSNVDKLNLFKLKINLHTLVEMSSQFGPSAFETIRKSKWKFHYLKRFEKIILSLFQANIEY